MAVTLTGAGGLFTRLGRLFGMGNDITTHQDDLVTEIADVVGQYLLMPQMEWITGLITGQDGFLASAGVPFRAIQDGVQTTIIEMVHADNPLPAKTLSRALDELITQMVASADTVDGTTVSSAVVAGGSNTGDGEVLVSLIDGDGTTLEYVRAEDIVLVCTKDAQVSGTAGRESFSVEGELSVGNRFDRLWPAGSGISSSLVLSDPSVDAFEDWTSDVPDSWTLTVGVASTDIQVVATPHRGTNAAEFIGDGATLTELRQTMAGGQTAPSLKPKTRYAIGVWVRDDGTTPAAGVLQIQLVDGAATAIGTFTVDLTAVGSTYAFTSSIFSTPAVLVNSGAYMRVRLSTALTAGRSAYVDGLCLIELSQFGGPGGPYLAIMPGATDFIEDDLFTVTITNNNEGEFQREMDRYCNLYGLGKFLPSDTGGAETVSDTLIT
jgi:hypothetical protein